MSTDSDRSPIKACNFCYELWGSCCPVKEEEKDDVFPTSAILCPSPATSSPSSLVPSPPPAISSPAPAPQRSDVQVVAKSSRLAQVRLELYDQLEKHGNSHYGNYSQITVNRELVFL